MGEALAHLHHCLEELTLLGGKRPKQFDDPGIRQGIGSLAQFKKLRRFKVCVEDLLRSDPRDEDNENWEDPYPRPSEKPKLADILPSSLQRLVLCKAENDIVVPLDEFLKDKKEAFPLLTNIVVIIPKLRDCYQEAERDLKSEYKDARIQLHMIHPGDPASGVAALLEDC
jgi:hypothetical protein